MRENFVNVKADGKIDIVKPEDYNIRFSGERPTLIFRHIDQKGIIGQISSYIMDQGCNISYMTYERSKIHVPSISVFETDQALTENQIEEMRQKFDFIEELMTVYVK